MTQALDVMIPLATMVSRFEKHRDELRAQIMAGGLDSRTISVLSGAISAYEHEIDAALRIGGATQMIALKQP